MPGPGFFGNTSNSAFRNTSISNVQGDVVNNHNPAGRYTIHNHNLTMNNYITNHTTHVNHNYYGMETGRGEVCEEGDDGRGLQEFLKRCIRLIFRCDRRLKRKTAAMKAKGRQSAPVTEDASC
ncbi:hypothetical protein L218DRAFT_1061813 [Marasmius fiardii PR-910]|nr:hypothetical protein L218DRAFT_1061813 [Marasmius fiardii PR-910]